MTKASVSSSSFEQQIEYPPCSLGDKEVFNSAYRAVERFRANISVVTGSCKLSEADSKAIKSFIAGDTEIQNIIARSRAPDEMKSGLFALFRRYQILSVRHNVSISDELRSPIYRQLAYDFARNVAASSCKIEHLVGPTIYCGDISTTVFSQENYQSYGRTVINYAIRSRPADVLGFLNSYSEAWELTMTSSAYAWFHDKPNTLSSILRSNVGRPLAALERALEAIETIEHLPEFKQLREEFPGLIRQAIAGHPGDPVAYLRAAQKVYQDIITDGTFEFAHSRPSLIRAAAFANPDKAKQKLLYIKQTVDEILADPSFIFFHDMPQELFIVVYSHRKPKDYLRYVEQEVRKIQSEEEFLPFINWPGFLRDRVINHTEHRQMLRKDLTTLQSIMMDPALGEYHSSPRFIALVLRSTASEGVIPRLKEISALTDEIEGEREFRHLGLTRDLIREVITNHTKEPRDALRGFLLLAQRIEEQGERFGIPLTTNQVMRIAVHHQTTWEDLLVDISSSVRDFSSEAGKHKAISAMI